MPSLHGRPDDEAGWIGETVARLRAESAPAAAVEDHLDIAGHGVRIRYGDPALAGELGRATRHLSRADPGSSDLTIDCWIADDAALRLPPAVSATGTMHVDDGTVVLAWDAAGGPLFGYDRTRRHAWARFDSFPTASTWEPTVPFRRILHWWAADNGMQMAHAAAVGRPTGGVLLVGRSGSGKSTTSLACLEAGLQFAADDGCLLEPGDPPLVHGLYVSAKGDANTAALLPGCRDEFTRSPIVIEGESVLFADRIRPDGISTGFPLRGIVVLRLGGSSSRLSALRPGAAMRALAPSTVLQMPGNRAAGLSRLAGIVRDLPAWELTLGPVPATAADLIGELLDREGGT